MTLQASLFPTPPSFAELAVSAFLAARDEQCGVDGLISEIEAWKEGRVTLAIPPERISEAITNAKMQMAHLEEIARLLKFMSRHEAVVRGLMNTWGDAAPSHSPELQD